LDPVSEAEFHEDAGHVRLYRADVPVDWQESNAPLTVPSRLAVLDK
jgi:hypothetical protein